MSPSAALPAGPAAVRRPAPAGRPGGRRVPPGLRPVDLRRELWLVFALSLGASGVRSLISLVGSLTRGAPLSTGTAVLNASASPGRPWLDLAFQVYRLAVGVVPVLMVLYLLTRSRERPGALGLDLRRWRPDLALGALLATLVGSVGLLFYLAVFAAGGALTVVPTALPDVWWRVPVLLLSAAQNALLEEVLVVGFLLHRLDQLGVRPGRALAFSALLRGSYHLYQGFGGFVGNAVMGVLFGRIYQRTGRVLPLVVAHFLIDAVAFVGYLALAGRVSWLPTP